MNYVISGAAGQISKPLVLQLLEKGQSVTVIGRNADHLEELRNAGAKAAIGSLEDKNFVHASFSGADAVFTMYPTQIPGHDIRGFMEMIAQNYANAIEANKIRYVVNLSSVGAHLAEGAGPVSGLHRAENILNEVPGLNIKHLRPVYFYSNLFAQIELIRNMGIMGSNFELEEFPISDPLEISGAAADELLNLDFTGSSVRYIASDETSTAEIAGEIGKAIGNPALRWIRFSGDQVREAMVRAGLPVAIARAVVEMFETLDQGRLTEDYWRNRPLRLGKTKMKDFAKFFATIYLGQGDKAPENA